MVLGGGESGVGAAILGKDKGMDVFLSDSGTIPERYAEVLRAEGIEFEQGGHTASRVLDADEVVKSPGIPPTAPLVKALVEKGVPVISEIELAGRYTHAKMVCITGSNGKTTTTIAHISYSQGRWTQCGSGRQRGPFPCVAGGPREPRRVRDRAFELPA